MKMRKNNVKMLIKNEKNIVKLYMIRSLLLINTLEIAHVCMFPYFQTK